MEFNHPTQHSIANLKRLAATVAAGNASPPQALYLASQLASHGHPWAEQVIGDLRKRMRHQQALRQLDVIERCFHNLRSVFRFEDLEGEARDDFYKLDGFVYLPRKEPSAKLLVIFATMFNNFHISNAATARLLGSLDCNLLILKDSTLLNYQRGVTGLAHNIPEIARAVERIAERDKIEKVYFTGFSSCGYAALLTSLMTRCDGYLGFSQPVDMSAASPLPPPLYFTADVRAALAPDHLVDLRPLLMAADPTIPRTLVYGEMNREDAAHARHVEDLPHLEIIALSNTSHSTIERLLARDALVPLFAKLISG